MEEEYRLVYRGEVAEGQHQAVVKKRLAALLQLDAPKAEQLFSGAAVVLRRSVDRATAAQFQAAFKKAGAKLRVQPIRYEEGATSGSTASTATAAAATVPAKPSVSAATAAPKKTAVDTSGAEHGLRLLPVGSLILEVHERLPPVENSVPTSHLQLDELSAQPTGTSDSEPAVAVNVDHLSVAETGSQLGPESGAAVEDEANFVFTFELAEDGSWLQAESDDQPVVIAAPDYELAEAGAVLAPAKPAEANQAPVPDVSHLSLQDDAPKD